MSLARLHCSEMGSNLGRAPCEARRVIWNLGINSAFAVGPKKTTENSDRVDRSQEPSDGKAFLARSPAFEYIAI
jgi:hypothetical protein